MPAVVLTRVAASQHLGKFDTRTHFVLAFLSFSFFPSDRSKIFSDDTCNSVKTLLQYRRFEKRPLHCRKEVVVANEAGIRTYEQAFAVFVNERTKLEEIILGYYSYSTVPCNILHVSLNYAAACPLFALCLHIYGFLVC